MEKLNPEYHVASALLAVGGVRRSPYSDIEYAGVPDITSSAIPVIGVSHGSLCGAGRTERSEACPLTGMVSSPHFDSELVPDELLIEIDWGWVELTNLVRVQDDLLVKLPD